MEYNLRDLEKWNEKIEVEARKLGLNYYPQEFDVVGFNEMIGYEAYVGMPSKYPHWSYGKSYEKTKTLYSLNLTGLPYEMVINSNPCLAYLMKDNTLMLQILTMAHVYGHNDFFKNNRLFKEGTNADRTLEMFKLDSEIIRGYINDPSIGYEKVEKVLDAAHSVKYSIKRAIGVKEISDLEIRERRIKDYKSSIETRDFLDMDKEVIPPIIDKIPLEPRDDVVGFIIEYGNLEEWEKNILRIVKRETEYFMPQIETKTMNEGWACYCHYNICKNLNLDQELFIEFIKRHNDVVSPIPGGLNPYYIGFKIFMDLEEKYGREKLFEVRALERDSSFIRKYLTRELCEELNLFQYGKRSFDFVVEEVADELGFESIRDNLAFSSGIGSIPHIRVIDLNKRDYTLTLEHVFDGRELEISYAKETLKNLGKLWGYKVKLITKGRDSDEFILNCDEKLKVTITDSNKK
ncbi:SpoVR family protein [Clostridium sp. LY3-2]|uniref:SpoVR family protein n=1 Tax=Clostridium sp. LY3-2 TaxID=2942482 RepID=UPI0021539D79|nr:SpoVR family protein [Clostridium sp. LY3-2]MCR6515655.1 SpoVR family protein [Clostridium sp. LY3-2]